MKPVVATGDNDIGSERTLKMQKRDRGNIMQRVRFIQVTTVVDTLAQQQGISLPSHPLSEIFLTFWIVDLVFCLSTVNTCECWALIYLSLIRLETVENS